MTKLQVSVEETVLDHARRTDTDTDTAYQQARGELQGPRPRHPITRGLSLLVRPAVAALLTGVRAIVTGQDVVDPAPCDLLPAGEHLRVHAVQDVDAVAHTFAKGQRHGPGRTPDRHRPGSGHRQDAVGRPHHAAQPAHRRADPDTDEQYEGCLSFFDVRGKVPRPIGITVEHQDLEGRTHLTTFEQGMARLVAHEVDHLHGMVYTARMRSGAAPIPASEYRGTGQTWTYQ